MQIEKERSYIGKSNNKNFDIFTRLFDHIVPKLSEEYPRGQVNNNTPEIWDDELNVNRNLKIIVCVNINFDPELLEVYLISRYKLKYGHYPKYNKETAKPFIKKSSFDSFVNYTNFLIRTIYPDFFSFSFCHKKYTSFF